MRRFIDDESGMTMALAMMMILLIGVMGAGLLTFVSRDLNSVVEVNQGTRAQEMADAGLEAAKRHLQIVDALPSSYDTTNPAGNSPWYDNAPDNQSGASGQTLTFNGNEVLVGIRYLDVPTTPDQARDPDYAPEELPAGGYFKVVNGVTVPDPCDDANGDFIDDDLNEDPDNFDPDACNYQNGRKYFRVTARGGSGDATRVVQAIFKTENFGSVPLSYYASRDIDFNGGATTMKNMSIFAQRNILNLRADKISGIDHAYGDWANLPGNAGPNPYNAMQRTDDAGDPVIVAGAAAEGKDCTLPPAECGIRYDPIIGGNISNIKQKSKTASPQLYGYRDYDLNTELSPILRPEFVANTWGNRADQPITMPGAKMTYPFAPPDPAGDAQAMAILKEKAQVQGLYFRPAPGSNFNIDTPPYPANSNLQNTVMFVEFAGGTDDNPIYGAKGHAEYRAQSSAADNVVKGTIVVMNGDLKISNSADPFQGAMIVRDGIIDGAADDTQINCNDSGPVMDFCSSGQVGIEGWVNVQSDIKLAGTVDGFLPDEMATGISSLIKVSQFSWRECYTTTCN
jgi:Tfp pilus assembly protein PilX